MQPLRVLVITPQDAPDFGPSAPIYTALCEDLSRIGCDVHVVTGVPHYGGSDLQYKASKKLIKEEIIGAKTAVDHVIPSPMNTKKRAH